MSWPVFIRALPLHGSLVTGIYVLFPAQTRSCPPFTIFLCTYTFDFNRVVHSYVVKMYSLPTLAALATLLSTSLALTQPVIPGLTYTWNDTFSGSSVNTNLWKFWTGQPSNGEQEVYPANGANCQITAAGTLLIVPLNTNGQWTSCRIESLETFHAKPGKKMRVQASLKLGDPGAHLQGIWPAFWSLGEGVRNKVGWPQCGEIDTFENIDGGALGYGTIHCSAAACNEPQGLTAGMTFDYGSYHTWAHVVDLTNANWRAQSITFLLDGREYRTVLGSDVGDLATWTTLVGPMFVTLNVAVGGQWPGSALGDTTSGPAAGMEVQYVAVYEG